MSVRANAASLLQAIMNLVGLIGGPPFRMVLSRRSDVYVPFD